VTVATIDIGGLNAFQFGDSPELGDRLAALVVAGRKTATCHAAVHGPLAKVGSRDVVLDGAKKPVAVLETASYTRLKFTEVTPAMAKPDGEGDLSHRFWADAHQDYFTREGTWSPDMDIYFEVFRLVEILDTSFACNAASHVGAEIAESAAKGFTALQGAA